MQNYTKQDKYDCSVNFSLTETEVSVTPFFLSAHYTVLFLDSVKVLRITQNPSNFTLRVNTEQRNLATTLQIFTGNETNENTDFWKRVGRSTRFSTNL